MARHARAQSCTNIYHVMLRGINKQQIFEDRFDYIQFIKVLYEVIPISNYEIHAYCLMTNHVHLLIKTNDESIAMVMKRITVRFAGWYNNKYDRHGHLFENRYKSEPIEDSKYYLIVIRYILQNPVKAGICKSIFDYPWSSAQSYFTASELIITQDIRTYFNDTNSIKNFLTESSDECVLEYDISPKRHPYKTEEQVKALFFSITGCKTPSEFQSLPLVNRKQYILLLVPNMTPGEISRRSGYSKSYVYKLINSRKKRDISKPGNVPITLL